jgi:hypothetical protein
VVESIYPNEAIAPYDTNQDAEELAAVHESAVSRQSDEVGKQETLFGEQATGDRESLLALQAPYVDKHNLLAEEENETFVHTATSETVTTLPEDDSLDENSSSSLQKGDDVPAPIDKAPGNDLTFEPYYTVDYFAAQGIKVSQEDLVKDKLGKQVKSFTEWLKTMKRLPAATVAAAAESIAEKKVESMATTSVTDSEVVTEAMAEVWAKQGNREKAAETYSKLSLLNPAKKAFFDAKIEHLKTL